MRAEVVVIKQGIAGESVTLPTEGSFFVGRGQECQLRFNDKGVSTVHCQFERRGSEWFLSDAASRNGTYLNGYRVSAASLRPGDIVVLGETALLFRLRNESDDESSETQVILYPNAWRAGPGDLLLSEEEMKIPLAGEDPSDGPSLPLEAWRTVLSELSDALESKQSQEATASAILGSVVRALGAERGLIAVHRRGIDPWQTLATSSASRGPVGVVASEALLRRAVEQRVAILTHDALADTRSEVAPSSGDDSGTRSAICVPFHGGGEDAAVLYLDSPTSKSVFGRDHLRLARAVSFVMALMLDSRRG